jgi:DNA-3-methyladenine glycosylase II
MAAPTRAQIAQSLSEADPALAALIDQVGPPPRRRPLPVAERFGILARAILHQQLATKAAATITSRVKESLGGSISPEGLLVAEPGLLRGCGVSGAKEAALRDLATHVTDGRLSLERLGRLDDEVVIDQLVAVRGIGRWTAEMFLMGSLGRHDVWPVGDLGVRNGWALLTRAASTPAPGEMAHAADHLRPWRSSVAWCCWRAVDLARDHGGSLPR